MAEAKRRGFGFWLVVAAAISVGLVGVITVASLSPDEAAARREPPELPPPTAQVQHQMLSDVVVAPCDLRQQTITVTAGDVAGQPLVVTDIGVTAGDDVSTGTLLLSVSGDPIISIESAIPFYRDLESGDVGDDVRYLEEALVDIGLLESADRRFDAATARGMEALYRHAGIDLDGTDVDPGRLTLRLTRSIPADAVVQQVHAALGHMVGGDDPLITLVVDGGTAECTITSDAAVSVGDVVEVAFEGDLRELPVVAVEPSEVATQQMVSLSLAGQVVETSTLELRHVMATSDGAVLSVPTATLSQGPGGGFEVIKVLPQGAERIAVTTGMVAGGWVEVAADGLQEGDEVRLHTEGSDVVEVDP